MRIKPGQISCNFFSMLFVACVLLHVFYSDDCYSQIPVKVRSAISMSGLSKTVTSEENTYIIQQSIGQTGITSTKKVNSYSLRQGFIQPPEGYSFSQLSKNLVTNVFPNPFNSTITFEFDEEIKDDIIVNIYNLQGSAIYCSTFLASQEIKLDIPQLIPGIYFVRIKSNKKYFNSKLIKQ